MTQPLLIPSAKPLLVLSASRRTDLVGCYPEFLAKKLQSYPPDKVHSIVLVTKNPRNMIKPGALRSVLEQYSQLVVHLTLTGLGGTTIEPNIQDWKIVLEMVPAIIDLVKGPERFCWRFDPIVRCRYQGRIISNIELFPEMAAPMARMGVRACKTSWVTPYKKALRRMKKAGAELLAYSDQERQQILKLLEETAAKNNLELTWCCSAGRGISRCIDGDLLNRLHPQGLVCSANKAKGQRKLCGCTESLDLGWYTQKCGHGCLYCYGEPKVE